MKQPPPRQTCSMPPGRRSGPASSACWSSAGTGTRCARRSCSPIARVTPTGTASPSRSAEGGRPPGGTRTVDDQGHVTTEGGKASPNPLLPVIDRAHRSLQVALEELLRPAPWAVEPAAAPDADGRHPEPEHPWLRHPDETAKAHAAFRYYRDLGEQRAAAKVWDKYGLSRGLVERWSTVHAWVRRVRAWDEHQDRIAVALSTDTIQTMRLEQADCGRTIQAAARETLDARMTRWRERGSAGEPPFSPFEAARLIRIGSSLEQTARGLEPAAPGELPGEALHEWAARIEAILGTEPGADEPIP